MRVRVGRTARELTQLAVSDVTQTKRKSGPSIVVAAKQVALTSLGHFLIGEALQ